MRTGLTGNVCACASEAAAEASVPARHKATARPGVCLIETGMSCLPPLSLIECHAGSYYGIVGSFQHPRNSLTLFVFSFVNEYISPPLFPVAIQDADGTFSSSGFLG